METNNITSITKNESLKAVQDLTEEIAQNQIIIKACDDIDRVVAIDESIRKIQANANIIKTTDEFSDVLNNDIAEKAKDEVQSSSVIVMSAKKDLETIINKLGEVNIDNLLSKSNGLISKAQDNIEKCDKWITIAGNYLKGQYDIADELLSEKENKNLEQDLTSLTKNEVSDKNENNSETLEPVLFDEEEQSNDEKLEPLGPVLFDDEEVDNEQNKSDSDKEKIEDESNPIETSQESISMDSLNNELDDADKVVDIEPAKFDEEDTKMVNDNLEDLVNEMNNDINEAQVPVEQNIDSMKQDLSEPSFGISSFNEDDSLNINTGETQQSADNVDKGAVKVVNIEEIGAPEQVQDNEQD